MSGVNVHDPQYRQAKAAPSTATRTIAELFRLDDRTILVTGATGFLGVEVALSILESGGHVVGLDVSTGLRPADAGIVVPFPVAPVYKEADYDRERIGRITGNDSQRWSYYQCNVTDSEAVTTVFAQLVSQLRYPLRGLVACAGVSDNGPAIEFPVASFRRLLDINVAGMFAVAQATARIMKDANVSGSMVLVASMSGHVSNKGVDTAAYNASKAAVHQLARSLAAEWGSRVDMPLIRVNSLSPGYIRTAATAEALQKPGMETQWVGGNMLYRLSTVDEFRAPVIFLLGDGSSFMTGADLRVDGGHCAW